MAKWQRISGPGPATRHEGATRRMCGSSRGSVDRNMVYADGAIKLANVEGPNGLICQ